MNVNVSKVISPLDVYTKADPKRRCPDLNKSRNLLNYNPEVELSEGIKRFISWAKDQEIGHINDLHHL